MKTPPWSSQHKAAALAQGPHKKLVKEHRKFLAEEFVAVMHKGHWVLLPAGLLMEEPSSV